MRIYDNLHKKLTILSSLSGLVPIIIEWKALLEYLKRSQHAPYLSHYITSLKHMVCQVCAKKEIHFPSLLQKTWNKKGTHTDTLSGFCALATTL